MPNEAVEQGSGRGVWRAQQVYTMAVVCLLVGLVIGYLFRGSASTVPQPTAPQSLAQEARATPPAATAGGGGMAGQMPSLDNMKKMADTKAAPLLEKLKSDPNNKDLLFQVGNIYKATHQFKDAAGYYNKALQADPKNVAVRTELASCLFYSGDVDGALSQLQQGLNYNPKDANSLFNLGMIKWQGKQDGPGALAAWRELLKSNPQLSADRKATVQKLMADVQKDVQKKGKS
jgi:cytochrome c-type biogenesis protein CcmH/NrfG